MSAWNDAVDREAMKKLKEIVEGYDSEFDLLNNAAEFGEAVWDLLLTVDEYEFKGTPEDD